MGAIKRLCGVIITTAVSAVTFCFVSEKYNQYAHDEAAKTELKNKLANLNPFKKKD